MAGKLKKFASVALAAVAMTVAIPGGSAWAIDRVPCGNRDFLQITAHQSSGPAWDRCYANRGAVDYTDNVDWWVTSIWTGNNRVQWYGDGRWQPEQPIGKYTSFTWPNHPGGVRMFALRIL
ncbi:hypothetical protein FHS29_005046 [Saccharothrix tamanrassetensis]|uniref:Streptomyces killer toxin-like beta/gamma crystallin domain-containing protein n=1 Tax=Saccharothrix tamanrassetensis TaxID=1051531 RepID=A0A841CQN0_9PSEU|nr:beta/gamma crystallin domain-containing protein [Saccharothrix tamanrassetensis]MBB5958438.1 hypothetical protein [Saccharothrix tamanrassetensis]